MIVYYWDHTLNRVKCVSHTCITADMRKRNEQVTKFIETVLQGYIKIFKDAGFGPIQFVSFWSDNCSDQFKCRYQFGWGSKYTEEQNLDAMFINFFAPGHGKGICDSEGGIAKHAVANAALHGDKFKNALDLYRWLKKEGGQVMSKTPLATHSPDQREYHFFLENEFLDYHPIDVKIDKVNCFYSFNLNKEDTKKLRARKTSCFCASCRMGNFNDCLEKTFHGDHHINQLNIRAIEKVPEHINLGLQMRNRMQELRTEFNKPYVVMVFEGHETQCPIYYLISPGAHFHPVSVRGHKLEMHEPKNYWNNTKFIIPRGDFCNIVNHHCRKRHTRLIRFDRICFVGVATTPAGTYVNVMKSIEKIGNTYVYDFKKEYTSLLEEYHSTRIKVFGNYRKL